MRALSFVFLICISLVACNQSGDKTTTPAAETKADTGLKADVTDITVKGFSFPVVSLADKKVANKINAVMSIVEDPGTDIKAYFEKLANAKPGEATTTKVDYKIPYNNNNIFSVVIHTCGMGAYESCGQMGYNFNLKSGDIISLNSLFKAASVKDVMDMFRKDVIADVKKTREAHSKEPEFDGAMFDQNTLVTEALVPTMFSVTENGLVLYNDFGFPHVIAAWEPSGSFTYTWAQLQNYIDPAGPVVFAVSKH